jgi:hypothetical protein
VFSPLENIDLELGAADRLDAVARRPGSGRYCPRRPDLDDGPFGFTTMSLGVRGRGALASGAAASGRPFCLCEKSGIDRGPFFFIESSWEKDL